MFSESSDPGLLVAFEGSDGSGKTTQRKLFKEWLKSTNEEVVVTKWNSSALFKPLIQSKKAGHLLDPRNYAVLHAADFRHRYETIIEPSLAQGKVVVADRYVFTGIARDVARGMNRDWSMDLYAPVRKPDVVFYFAGSAEVFARRIAAIREIKFYEAGQDVTGTNDAYQSYLEFAPRVLAEYERLHSQFGFVILNAHESIYEQHQFIREAYLNALSHCRIARVSKSCA